MEFVVVDARYFQCVGLAAVNFETKAFIERQSWIVADGHGQLYPFDSG